MRSTSVPAERDPPRKCARLIVLLCDTPVPPVLESKGTYADIFTTLFRRSLELRRREEPSLRDVELDIASYDVVKAGEYPDDAALEAADGLLMTGSGASCSDCSPLTRTASNAYDPLPWIDRLVAFTAQLPDRHPALPIIGICFGFQIAARALGGRCERNPAGWELGVRECSLTDLGRAVLGTERMVRCLHHERAQARSGSIKSIATTCPSCRPTAIVRARSREPR